MNTKLKYVKGLMVFFFLSGSTAFAQYNYYWVSFKDKPLDANSILKPELFLSSKSIERRTFQHIQVSMSDVPLNINYLQQLSTLKGIQILQFSKWLNGVVLKITDTLQTSLLLHSIASIRFVKSVETIKPKHSKTFNTGAQSPDYAASRAQIQQMGVHCLHEHNFKGQQITIAVMDVGFIGVNQSAVFDSLMHSSRFKGGYNFVTGDHDVFKGGSHGTMVLSCLAANIPGKVIGAAPQANYWLFNTENGASETLLEEFNWIRAAEYADSVGVDIITTSLGYTEFDNPQQNHNYASLNGKTAPMSIAATMAARKGILVINAAGNEGNGPWKYISVPADADSILAVGAVDTTGRVASFSGYGPTADGRIKPDVSACGWGTWICDGASNCFYGNGTSFAAPLIAGAAACYWQQHKTLSNIEILNRIKSKSSFAQKPNNRIGWGVPNLCMPLTDLDFTLAWIKELKGVRIRLSETYYSELHLKIYNTQGQLVYVSALPISQWVHDMVLPLASGVYIFEIQSNRGVRTKKVIIP